MLQLGQSGEIINVSRNSVLEETIFKGFDGDPAPNQPSEVRDRAREIF